MLAGYRTYIMAVLIGIHGILRAAGLEMGQEEFSQLMEGMINLILAVGVIVYRKKATG